MYIKTLIYAAITLVFTSFPALAATPQVHQLRTMTSAPGQSKVAFLVDVAHWMRAWSDKTGFEACGEIAQNANGWAVVVTTSRSHIGCSIYEGNIPRGMVPTRVTIHTHIRRTRATVTHNDRHYLTPAMRVTHVLHVRITPNRFAPADYRAGAGYLVGLHKLHYQDGWGTSRIVKDL